MQQDGVGCQDEEYAQDNEGGIDQVVVCFDIVACDPEASQGLTYHHDHIDNDDLLEEGKMKKAKPFLSVCATIRLILTDDASHLALLRRNLYLFKHFSHGHVRFHHTT